MLAEYDATGRTAIAAPRSSGTTAPGLLPTGEAIATAPTSRRLVRLYGARGQQEMLAIAQRTYAAFDQTHPTTGLERLSDDKPITEHAVTFNETAKLPGCAVPRDWGTGRCLTPASTAYHKVDRDHMLASGLHSAEERLRGNDPGLYHETCNVSDYAWSVGYLLMGERRCKLG